MEKEINIFKDIEEIAEHAVEIWTGHAEKSIKKSGRFTVALSGGSTPIALYEKLSKVPTLPWDRTGIFIVDERFVPYESNESNFGMIRRVLLKHLSIPDKNIHPIPTLNLSPQDAAIEYEHEVREHLMLSNDDIPIFDLILLGLGDDGHTASLFPGTPALKEASRLSLFVEPPDKTKKTRISITLTLINNARNLIFIAAGKNKAPVIKEIIEDKSSTLPAAMVRPRKGKLLFLLDKDAASLINIK